MQALSFIVDITSRSYLIFLPNITSYQIITALHVTNMQFNTVISPRVFTAIQNVNIKELSKCSQKEIRPLLPCLVRMSLILSVDITKECVEARKEILTVLSGIESVNSIVALLSIDFHALETDVRKEQQLRLVFNYFFPYSLAIGCKL